MKKIIKKYSNLIEESRWWVKLSFFIFLAAIFSGIVTFFFRDLPFLSVILNSLSKISELAKEAKAQDAFGRFLIIYKNNILSMIMILYGGIILGIFTVIGLFTNGMLLGFFSFLLLFANLPFFSKAVLLLLVVPHGILELSLLVIASAWGIKLGTEHLLPKSKGKRISIFLNNLRNSLFVFLFLAIGLSIAAAIEVLDMKIAEILVR